jgi:uncharacterized protein (TIGR02147 family)
MLAWVMSRGSLGSAPKVQAYLDFRSFLSDWFQWRKKLGGYSYKKFAQDVGLASPAFLLLVIQGRRNLSLDIARKIGEAMKLSKSALTYFLDLCAYNQSSNPSDKIALGSKVSKVREGSEAHLMEKNLFSLYSSWHFIVIRELVATSDFQDDPQWISDRCANSITPFEAKKALDFLINSGFIARDQNDRLVQTQAQLWSGEDIISLGLHKFQQDMIQKGAQALEQLEASEREISSVTVRLSKTSADLIKKKIQALREEILHLEKIESSSSVEIYQANFQVFPLTKKVPKREGSS